ncbi:hypothetical protein [Spiroplasma sp. SV19]|uniref:SLAC1 family transporter n=1 Tax=Spiroplasma sp. SV19 TaxID=2570468 RepID=UPI0024B695B1|nr:hypothetical protein [Spiroplasma sp. SV19]WHQ36617.1 hypothetical protein E7Y35_01580 [Spiroplasma sp. SV19]
MFTTNHGFHFKALWLSYLTFAIALIFICLIIIKLLVNFEKTWHEFIKTPNKLWLLIFLPMGINAIGRFILAKQSPASLTVGWIYQAGMTIYFLGFFLAVIFWFFWVFQHITFLKLRFADPSWLLPTIGLITCNIINVKYLGRKYIIFLQILWYIVLILLIFLILFIWLGYLFFNRNKQFLASFLIFLITLNVVLMLTYNYNFVEVEKNQASHIIILILGNVPLLASLLFYILILKTLIRKKFNISLISYIFPIAISSVGKNMYGEYLTYIINRPLFQETLIISFRCWALIELLIATIIFVYSFWNLCCNFISNKNNKTSLTNYCK